MFNLKNKTQAIRDFSSDVLFLQSAITLNWDLISDLSQQLISRKITINTQTDLGSLSLERQIGLILIYGSVHYCFTNPRSKKEFIFQSQGRRFPRSLGFITALKSSDVLWENFDSLSKMSLDKWYNVLQTEDEKDLYDLKERYERIISFSRFLVSKGIKDAADFLKKYQTAEDLIDLLESSSFFTDPFLKRAQVTAYLISATLEKYQKSSFADIDLLTAMPDYRLPQLLYNIGILVLPEHLKESLLKQQIVDKNSSEELVLRAAVVIVAEKISDELLLPECIIDSLMWGLAQDYKKQCKLPIPAMLVETDCY